MAASGKLVNDVKDRFLSAIIGTFNAALNLNTGNPYFIRDGVAPGISYNSGMFPLHPLLMYELHSQSDADTAAPVADAAFAKGGAALGKPGASTAEADDWTTHGADFWKDGPDPVKEIIIDGISCFLNKAEQRKVIDETARGIEESINEARFIRDEGEYLKMLLNLKEEAKHHFPVLREKIKADREYHEDLERAIRSRLGL